MYSLFLIIYDFYDCTDRILVFNITSKNLKKHQHQSNLKKHQYQSPSPAQHRKRTSCRINARINSLSINLE